MRWENIPQDEREKLEKALPTLWKEKSFSAPFEVRIFSKDARYVFCAYRKSVGSTWNPYFGNGSFWRVRVCALGYTYVQSTFDNHAYDFNWSPSKYYYTQFPIKGVMAAVPECVDKKKDVLALAKDMGFPIPWERERKTMKKA